MNSRIRVARGTNKAIGQESYADVVGHPLYNIDKKYLYIGDGTTAIKNNEPITTNRIEGWLSDNTTNFDSPDYIIHGNSDNMYINSKMPIKFNVNNTDIITIEESGLVVAENKVVAATKFVGDLEGNADTATTVNITSLDTTSDAEVKFQIGTGELYSKTVNNVERAQYYITNNATLTSDTTKLAPFTWYKASDAISSLTIEEYTSSAYDDVIGEWFLKFTAGSDPLIDLGNVLYANGWTKEDYESGNTYTIYIIDGVAYVSVIEPTEEEV